MSIVKYRIAGRFKRAEIEAVEVSRETDKYVFVLFRNRKVERKELKISDWNEYYDTWEDAHAALTLDAEWKVKNARRNLELANSYVGNIKGMRPDPAAKEVTP